MTGNTVCLVERRKDGKRFELTVQMVDLNFNDRYVLRYNIGIDTYHDGWKNVECIYDNDEFNKKYKVIGVVTERRDEDGD